MRPIDQYALSLFQHGLETYDKDLDQRDPSSKGSVNQGGAKAFAHLNLRSPDSPILINNKELREVIFENPVTLFTLNRIDLDEKGRAKRTPDGKGFSRKNTGLMLYCDYDADPECGKKLKELIVNKIPNVPLGDYIEVASEILDPEGKLKVLEQVKHSDFSGNLAPLKLHAALLLALPSGAKGAGNRFWSFDSQKIKTRKAMSDRTTASTMETEDLPY